MFLIHLIPGKSIAESIRRQHFIVNLIHRFLQIFAHNQTYDFYQEVKSLRIFEHQINKYERTKEYINASHKFETRV